MQPLLALALLLPALARASHEDVGFNARSAGMADAVMAAGDDLAALTLNPAALGQLRQPQAEGAARKLRQPPERSREGFALGAATPLPEPLTGVLGVGLQHDNVSTLSLDRVHSLTYGTRNWREVGSWMLEAGASLKHLSRSGRSVTGDISRVAADVGALLRLSDADSLGVSALNLNRPRTDIAGVAERAPLILKAGLARSTRGFLVAADVSRREAADAQGRSLVSAAVGAEYLMGTARHGSLAARSGLSLGGLARAWSLGVGWRVLGMRLDYALRIPFSGGSRWSHAVALSYRFGSWDPESEYERVLAGEVRFREDLAQALEASEVKQWRLSEELRLLKEELAELRKELTARQAETGEARQRAQSVERELRVKELEDKRRRAQERLDQLQREREELARKNKEVLYREDWKAYGELRRQGVSDLVLIERVKQVLRQYKGAGVDLGEANQELQRLLRRGQ